MNHHPVGNRLLTLVVLVATITFAATPGATAAAAPPNDLIENATVVDGLPFSVTQTDMAESTKAGEPAPSCFGGEYGTVWFRYDPADDTALRVRTDGATLVLYEGSPGALQQLSCGASMEPVTFRGGTTYYFMVATFFGLGPPRPATFALEIPSPPANDLIENATVVDTVPFSVTQTDMAESTKAGEPAPSCFGGEYGTVWFRYDPADDTALRVRTDGATLVLYEGSPGALQQLSCGASMEPVTFRGGTTYYFMVATFFGLGPPRPATFALEIPSPPANDLIENATVVDTVPFSVTQTDTRDATNDGEPTPSCFGAAYGSVWFRYDAPADAVLRVRGSAVIYEGSPGALREVACGQQLQPVAFQSSTTYYFMVITPPGVNLPVTFSLETATPPANDLIENASLVTQLPFSETHNDMVDATKVGEPAPSCFSGAYGTVWFRYDVPSDTMLRADVGGFGGSLVIYEGSPEALREVSCGRQLAPAAFRGDQAVFPHHTRLVGFVVLNWAQSALDSPRPLQRLVEPHLERSLSVALAARPSTMRGRRRTGASRQRFEEALAWTLAEHGETLRRLGE